MSEGGEAARSGHFGRTWQADVPYRALGGRSPCQVVFITAHPSAISEVRFTITSASNSSGGVTDISKHTAFSGTARLKIAGAATVMATYGAAPMLKMTGDATETITVDCGEGVALGADASCATEFWFCIPPVSFAKGFTVTVTDTKGVSVEYSTAISRRVMRNVMTTMAPIEADFTPAPVDLGLSVKWACVNVCAESPEDVGGRFAWGEVEPKTSFDWTNKTGARALSPR